MRRTCLAAGLIALLVPLAGQADIPVAFSEVSLQGESYGPAVSQLAVHPLDGRRLIAAGSWSVQVSVDGGASWRTTASRADRSLPGPIERLFVHKGRPGVVFLRGIGFRVGTGIQYLLGYTLKSEDFGDTWSFIADESLEEGSLVMSPFASDPKRPEHLYATKVIPGARISPYGFGSDPAEITLVESIDRGKTWSAPLSTFPVLARSGIRSIEGPTPATPQRIFFTSYDGGSFVSTTAGAGWTEFPFPFAGRFFWVRQDPANADVIYASAELANGVDRGIVRSTDSGNSWQLIYPLPFDSPESGMANYGEIAIDAARSSRLWLTTVKAGVLLSEDRGTSWQSVDLPEPPPCDWGCLQLNPGTTVPRVVASPMDPSQVYLIWKGRLFRGVLTARGRVAVEYQYGARFWITGDAGEALSQDYRADEAVRTGQRFGLWGRADAPAGALGLCRFQGNPAHGQSSRFLTLKGAECGALRGDPGWVLEGEDEAFAVPAGPGGQCAAGTVAVTRFVNGFRNANHRYVVDAAVAKTMRESGWIEEGVAFCARTLGADE